jgi:hypothetical protein
VLIAIPKKLVGHVPTNQGQSTQGSDFVESVALAAPPQAARRRLPGKPGRLFV